MLEPFHSRGSQISKNKKGQLKSTLSLASIQKVWVMKSTKKLISTKKTDSKESHHTQHISHQVWCSSRSSRNSSLMNNKRSSLRSVEMKKAKRWYASGEWPEAELSPRYNARKSIREKLPISKKLEVGLEETGKRNFMITETKPWMISCASQIIVTTTKITEAWNQAEPTALKTQHAHSKNRNQSRKSSSLISLLTVKLMASDQPLQFRESNCRASSIKMISYLQRKRRRRPYLRFQPTICT